MDSAQASFIRGIRVVVRLLETINLDECTLVSSNSRWVECNGAAQRNSVLEALTEVMARGDEHELEGFCAALTEALATGDENGDSYRMLGSYADRRERVMERWGNRRHGEAAHG
jgi:hypothetical protein